MGKKNKSSNAKISCPLPDYIFVMDEDTHNSFGDKKGYGCEAYPDCCNELDAQIIDSFHRLALIGSPILD